MNPTRSRGPVRAHAWWLLGLVAVGGGACSTTINDDDDSIGTFGGSGGQAGSSQGGSENQAGGAGQAGNTGKPSTAGNGGGGEGGSGGTAHRCTSPVTDPKTGLVKCKEGYWHRPTAQACGKPPAQGGAGGAGGDRGTRLPRVDGNVPCDPDGQGGTTGSDCSGYENGYCRTIEAGGATSFCESGCSTDADCDVGNVCVCDDDASPTGGRCKPGNCSRDADCGAGLLCASYSLCDDTSFACQRANDTCQSDADCESGTCLWFSHDPGGRMCVRCGIP